MIVASFSKDKIVELCKLNVSPCYAYSVASYDLDNMGMFSVLRGPGEFSPNKIDDDPMFYHIVYLHPTECGRDIQPPCHFEESTDHYLWMDGELDQLERDKIKFDEQRKEEWDAMLLCCHVARFGAPVDVEGTFACMYCDGTDLYMFRNEPGSLFSDDDFNICSTPFPGSITLPSNKVWEMNMEKKKLKKTEEFQTVQRWYPKP